MNQNYGANLKLKKKKQIEFLFRNGKKHFSYPFMMVTHPMPELEEPIKFGVSVRKKDFKKAVMRNSIKRKMRECFRLNKEELYTALQNEPHLAMLIYIGKEEQSFQEMEKGYLKLVKKLDHSL